MFIIGWYADKLSGAFGAGNLITTSSTTSSGVLNSVLITPFSWNSLSFS